MKSHKQEKKILYIDHSKAPGGAPISLLTLIMNLDQDRFDVTVICNSTLMENFYSENGIKTRLCPLLPFQHTTNGWWRVSPVGFRSALKWLFQFSRSCKELSKILHDIQPDVVHLNSLTLTPYAEIVNKSGFPVVVHVRESVVDGYFGLRKKILGRKLAQYADKVIFICRANEQRLDGCKSIVLYNPVDFAKFNSVKKSEAKNKLGINEGCRVVLYVGGLRAFNGPIVFAKALKYIVKEVANIRVLMPSSDYVPSSRPLASLRRKIANAMGIYSIRQRVDKEISRNGLSNKVIRSRFCNNIGDFFSAADVVVVPSIEPHFARPVIEAGAASVPVVASRIDGITEVIDDGKTGFLFEPGSSKELAEKVLVCLKDSDLSQEMGRRANQLVKACCDPELYSKKISDLYDSLIKRK